MTQAGKLFLYFFAAIVLLLLLKNPASTVGVLLAGGKVETDTVKAFGGGSPAQKGNVSFGGGTNVKFG